MWQPGSESPPKLDRYDPIFNREPGCVVISPQIDKYRISRHFFRQGFFPRASHISRLKLGGWLQTAEV